MREVPTVPADPLDPGKPWAAAFREDAAVELPKKHCAFKGCLWKGSLDETLLRHLAAVHGEAVDGVAKLLPMCYAPAERRFAAYNEAIATLVRKGAPMALDSIDRRCLQNYSQACREGAIQASICFFCACVFPRMELRRTNGICWIEPFDLDGNDKFCLFTREQTSRVFSLKRFLERYARGENDLPTSGST